MIKDIGGILVSSTVFALYNAYENVHGYYSDFVMASTHTVLLASLVKYYECLCLTINLMHGDVGYHSSLLFIYLCLAFSFKNIIMGMIMINAMQIIMDNNSINPIKCWKSTHIRNPCSCAWDGNFHSWMVIHMDKLVDPPVPKAFLINPISLGLSHCLFSPVAVILPDKYGRIPTLIL